MAFSNPCITSWKFYPFILQYALFMGTRTAGGGASWKTSLYLHYCIIRYYYEYRTVSYDRPSICRLFRHYRWTNRFYLDATKKCTLGGLQSITNSCIIFYGIYWSYACLASLFLYYTSFPNQFSFNCG